MKEKWRFSLKKSLHCKFKFLIFHSDPQPLLENPKFQKFLKEDLLTIIENSMGVETIMNWSKFIVYCKLDDPYLWPAITGKVKERATRFYSDQLLVILVNCAHSLSSETSNLFGYIGAQLNIKMNREYTPPSDETILIEEDIPKVRYFYNYFRL